MNTKLVAVLAFALALVSACQTANAPANNASLPANTTANNSSAAANSTPATTVKTVPTDLNKLAERIVTQSAGVKEGEIVFVSPDIDPLNTQVRVWAEVENTELKLRPGMQANLTVEPR